MLAADSLDSLDVAERHAVENDGTSVRIPLPENQVRGGILAHHAKARNLELNATLVSEIAGKAEGLSVADLMVAHLAVFMSKTPADKAYTPSHLSAVR